MRCGVALLAATVGAKEAYRYTEVREVPLYDVVRKRYRRRRQWTQ